MISTHSRYGKHSILVSATVCCGFLLRTFVAVWNGFFGPSFGADVDALGFHQNAVDYSKDMMLKEMTSAHLYSYLLGAVYRVTGASLFLGSMLSVVVWLISAGVVLRTLRLLAVGQAGQFYAMALYALLPSSILYTSVTLREVYQLLFVNLSVYSALRIYLNRSRAHWFILILSGLGMGLMHGGLLVLAVFIFMAAVIMSFLFRRRGLYFTKIMLIGPVVAAVVFGGLSLFTNFSYSLDKGVATTIESYQKGELTGSRAQYIDEVKIDGLVGLLRFVPTALAQYLFEPVPWRASTVPDIELLVENALRAWLIWKALIGLRGTWFLTRRAVIFVFLSYLLLEGLWAIGTTNWGTASRHHVPSIGLLVIAAFAGERSKRRVAARAVEGAVGFIA